MEAKDFTSFIGKTLVDIQQGLNKEGTITFLFEDDEKTQTGFKILPKGVGRLEMCESTVYGGEESSPKKIKRKKKKSLRHNNRIGGWKQRIHCLEQASKGNHFKNVSITLCVANPTNPEKYLYPLYHI